MTFLKHFQPKECLLIKQKCVTMKFRSKRTDHSLVIHSKLWHCGRIYAEFFGQTPICASEPLLENLDYDSRLVTFSAFPILWMINSLIFQKMRLLHWTLVFAHS